MSQIRDFYHDKTLFITGATGFVGKVLLEKLLYSCPNVRRVYILVRTKKGVQPQDRLLNLLASPVFTGTNRVPKHVLKAKIFAMAGDAAVARLGLSDNDWNTLVDEVNVVINSAASVRFDDPMIKALGINCLSTVSCIELCKQAKNLQSFIHVSTCYANCNRIVNEEKVYPMKVKATHLLELAKWMNPDKLDALCREELAEGRPNTYVLTKALAEDYVNDHCQGLPSAIARLSIVMSARREPEPGFSDVTQAGVFVAFTQGLGALRTFDYKPNQVPEGISVDTVANTLLALGWLTATKYKHESVRVYNITSRLETIGNFFKKFSDEAWLNPSSKAFRPPVDLTKPPSRFSYQYHRWISEWLFVFILEKILRIFGMKHKLVEKMKLLDDARRTLQDFTFVEYKFPQQNFDNIHKEMNETDRKIFSTDMSDLTVEEVDKLMMLGWKCLKKYKLKESVTHKDVKQARKRMKMLQVREAILHVFIYAVVALSLYSIYKIISTAANAVVYNF